MMGRLTFESFPEGRRPLPGRFNVVVTSRRITEAGVQTAASLEAAVAEAARISDVEDVFIFGGAKIYKDALDNLIPEELLISVIDGRFHCDTFLSDLPPSYILEDSMDETYEGTKVVHQRYRLSH